MHDVVPENLAQASLEEVLVMWCPLVGGSGWWFGELNPWFLRRVNGKLPPHHQVLAFQVPVVGLDWWFWEGKWETTPKHKTTTN